jgi:hypothetical protein
MMSEEIVKCELCGEPMPVGETMFKFHGYSGSCPKPPLLQPHQQRVIDEKTEFDKKAHSLSQFIGHSAIFDTIDLAEQERLKEQNDIMWQYSEILGARIAAFKHGG